MRYLILTLVLFWSTIGLAAPLPSLQVSDFYTDSTFSEVYNQKLHPGLEAVWVRSTIQFELDRYPYYLEIGNWEEVAVYQKGLLIGRTGLMLPMSEKAYNSHRNLVIIEKPGIYLIKINISSVLDRKGSTADIQLLSHDQLKNQEDSRLIGQSIYFGLILIMSLYNLMIYFSVRDKSYLYYVQSIVGIGLYLFFFYGFTIEYFWPESPWWNIHFFALIIPLTNVMRIFFTKSYLDTKKNLPGWNRFLNILNWVYVVPLALWFLSYENIISALPEANSIIGFLGTTVMTTITLVSILVYRQGYKPALWFLLAYILFNIGGILFIFRELGYLSDNFFTRYLLQYGVAAQVILFSLGLASRLNEVRKKLADEILQMEILKRNQETERKRIIENQKKELEVKVKERTRELEELIDQITQSEKELKELNSLKDKLFSIISHDLKSPLTTVDSFLNLLINHHDKLSKDDLAEVSSKTKFALQNLTLLLDNLLQWSRLQQNYVSFNPIRVKLKDLIYKNQKLFKLLLEEKDLKLESSHTIDFPEVWVDKDMMDFVIRNLIHNSIKFSVRGSKISISIGQDGDQALFVIRDQGRGMSSKEINQILVHGERFSKTGTEKEKGSGIGLLMCKDFVERNGGDFTIKTQKQGLEVSFTCPLAGKLV